MNRADRRRKQKTGQKIKSEPVLHVKPTALNTMVKAIVTDKLATDVQTAKQKALHEINQQILAQDEQYSLDIDAMILWTLHQHYGWGKKRLEEFYANLMNEHTRMRNCYQIDDTYPERAKLKSECGVDVEALNQKFLETCHTESEA